MGLPTGDVGHSGAGRLHSSAQCLYASMCLNVSMCVNVFAGLASALGLLKERGRLNMESHMVWAGRTNDRSKNALQGLVGE
jgi:hypothetical protein